MAAPPSWKALWRSWRRPLLLPAFLLLVALTATVLPPVAGSLRADVENLALFDGEPTIRVLLERVKPTGRFAFGGPVRVRDRFTTRVLERGGTARWDGRAVRIGDLAFTPPVRIAAPRGAPLEIQGRRYDGTLALVVSGRNVLVVNRVPLETYVAGVIAAEMGMHFPEEALKAQAVACRTYAVWRMRARRRSAYDVGVTQATQVYRGASAAQERARRLVAATRGLILAHEAQVLDALYSSTCGGATRSASEAFGDPAPPPLSGVPCGHCNDAPRFKWTVAVPNRSLARALGLPGTPTAYTDPTFFRSGRLKSVTIRIGSTSRVVSGARLRRALGSRIHSPWITDLSLNGSTLSVSGRGFGHGVGLCQYGARGLARRQRDARQILAWYYPGAETARAW